jgi:hypothetical protein
MAESENISAWNSYLLAADQGQHILG